MTGRADLDSQRDIGVDGAEVAQADRGLESPASPRVSATPADAVLALQRGAGNAAVARYLEGRRSGSGRRLDRDFAASYPVTHGAFDVDLRTIEGALSTPPAISGLDGYIRFVPNPDAPNSNQIVMVQIVRTTDAGNGDIDSDTTPPLQAPRGALGDPGLRTEEDAARGVEGGFKTDVYHRRDRTSPGEPEGAPVSPRYDFQPAPSGRHGTGDTEQPAEYGGGIGGVRGQTPGFKRSSDPADIRSAAMYDRPGTGGLAHRNKDFETVAKGEDTMFVYGAVKWGFQVHGGHVQNEYLEVQDGPSATFDEALERHRDFYVHEPVTFYFRTDNDTLDPAEAAKIDTFREYLDRNPTVRMSISGFADNQGGASAHNRDLARRRGEAVAAGLVDKGVDAMRVNPVAVSVDSTAATADAGTGDQGGDAAVGADQNREANRWANRRVELIFEETVSHAPSTPGGGGTP